MSLCPGHRVSIPGGRHTWVPGPGSLCVSPLVQGSRTASPGAGLSAQVVRTANYQCLWEDPRAQTGGLLTRPAAVSREEPSGPWPELPRRGAHQPARSTLSSGSAEKPRPQRACSGASVLADSWAGTTCFIAVVSGTSLYLVVQVHPFSFFFFFSKVT